MARKYGRSGNRPLKPPPVCKDKDRPKPTPPPPPEVPKVLLTFFCSWVDIMIGFWNLSATGAEMSHVAGTLYTLEVADSTGINQLVTVNIGTPSADCTFNLVSSNPLGANNPYTGNGTGYDDSTLWLSGTMPIADAVLPDNGAWALQVSKNS